MTATLPRRRPITRPSRRAAPDARALAIDLLNDVSGEVRFDPGSRALYATDASNYRQVPIGVVLPRTTDDVLAAIEICHRHGAPLVNRGGGTSLAGQGCNVAVVLDHSKYHNRLLEIDKERRHARVEPGIVLDTLRDAAEEHHLTFGPDPATHDHCTLGGMLGNDSCGVHSVMSGRTAENVEELEVVTAGGTRLRVGPTSEEELAAIIGAGGERGRTYAAMRDLRDRYADLIRTRFPHIPRRVSGYNLDELLPENGFNVARALVGSESTLVTILAATLRLVESPPGRTLVVLGYPDVYQAADHVPEVLRFGPIGLEGIDDGLVRDMRGKHLHTDDLALLPPGRGWLLVEFGGADRAEADANAQRLLDALGQVGSPTHKRYDDPDEEAHIWKVRESGLGATAMVPGEAETWPGWEDSAVDPAQLGDYLRDLRRLWDDYGYRADMYGHFGQGCLHCRIDFDLTSAGGIETWRRYLHDAAQLVVRHGGSLSGEHGDGQARAELLPIMFGNELVEAFNEFKAIWDPENRMNPGKVVHPYRVDQNLRLGTGYNPPAVTTEFRFPEDNFSFGHAALRCVGVGECRRHGGGTMCPSYMVTREEKHSTRGRARLLFEMLNGELRDEGWRSPAVREALDLCLACKGCKGDCPVNVDMATYKAEFLSHYYRGRLRPAAAYSMGLIYWWSGLAARAPRLVNGLANAPVLGTIGKRLGGIAGQRQIPRFAAQTFRAAWRRKHPGAVTTRRGTRPRGGDRRVILWPDTFNDHFHPETAQAAADVLAAAGFEVVIPHANLCCGRPLYDWGLLGPAKSLLRQALRELAGEIASGTPIIGLEPSCVSVFRDELVNLLPRRADAHRLSNQTFLLSEFLAARAPEALAGRLAGRRALVFDHCHHKSVLGTDAERSVLDASGLEYEALDDAGCCGMAGSFGFEASHYDVSMAVGERALLPAVRATDPATTVIADGFSCREQITQATGRSPRHLAEVLAEGLSAADSR
jgi:FAD/FMN-containing dehydrogenase/Fe-S oxidoreductase